MTQEQLKQLRDGTMSELDYLESEIKNITDPIELVETLKDVKFFLKQNNFEYKWVRDMIVERKIDAATCCP